MTQKPADQLESDPQTWPTLRKIGVYPPAACQRYISLFAALAELEPVRFQPAAETGTGMLDALILCDVPLSSLSALRPGTPPVFACITDSRVKTATQRGTIQFAHSPALATVLRGQVFPDTTANMGLEVLPEGAEVLAAMNSIALWAKCRQTNILIDLVSGPLPELTDQHPYLFPHYQRDSFISLLPLLHFIRDQVRTPDAGTIPVRACFMFDDPNLHWSSFGFINYRSLAASARRHHYHVSFATVPLDGWYSHRPAVKLFRENTEWLSFLIHGNNHTREELAQSRPEPQRIALAAQALRRIEALEKRTGISIPKVMAAPHGACTEAMAEAMLRTGYSAACISRGSLMYHNGGRTWRPTTGLTPAEFVAADFPVIPRNKLIADAGPQIILAAFLGQPVILVGHHNDVSNGYGLLEDLAKFINRLGPVSWMNMDAIARSNNTLRQNGNNIVISLYSRHVTMVIPAGVTRMRIRRPWLIQPGTGEKPLEVEIDGAKQSLRTFGLSPVISVSAGSSVEIYSPTEHPVDYRRVASPPFHLWALTRRFLAEMRDRLVPVFQHLKRIKDN